MKINENKRDLKANMLSNPDSIPLWKQENSKKEVLDYVKKICKKCDNYSKMRLNKEDFHICNSNGFAEVGWYVITEFSVIACQLVKEMRGY